MKALLCLFPFLLYSCLGLEKEPDAPSTLTKIDPSQPTVNSSFVAAPGPTNKVQAEDFKDFYARFSRDSTFQTDRIVFPLPGLDSDVYTVEDANIIRPENFTWKREDWKTFDLTDSTTHSRVYLAYSDSLVTEKLIYAENSGFCDVLTYKVIAGKWFLVRYEAYNL